MSLPTCVLCLRRLRSLSSLLQHASSDTVKVSRVQYRQLNSFEMQQLPISSDPTRVNYLKILCNACVFIFSLIIFPSKLTRRLWFRRTVESASPSTASARFASLKKSTSSCGRVNVGAGLVQKKTHCQMQPVITKQKESRQEKGSWSGGERWVSVWLVDGGKTSGCVSHAGALIFSFAIIPSL
jgi:hypothetical protein